MDPVVVLASATLGVALWLSGQSFLRFSREHDGRGHVEGFVTLLAGTMTFTAAAVATSEGSWQSIALVARSIHSMVIFVPLLYVLGYAVHATPPRWMTRLSTVVAGAIVVATLTTDLYVVRVIGETGTPEYGPLYLPGTALLGALLAVWLVRVVRLTQTRLDAWLIIGAVAVPLVLIVGDIIIRAGPHEVVWAVSLPPLILSVEAVRQRRVRAQRRERAASASERERLLHDLAVAHDQLAVANRTRQNLLDAASHELRMPLTAVLGFAQTLRSHADKVDEQQRADIIERLEVNARRLGRVIDGILTAQTLQAGSQTMLPDEVLLRPVLELSAAMFSQLDANVTIDCADGTRVWADPLYVPRIVTSVVANAAQHGRPPVAISAATDGDAVRIVVRDRGPGISEVFEPQLFLPFERASSGLTRVPGGIGLGLANAAALAASCGGSLVHIPTEQGACFEISLPARRDAAAARVHG